MRGGRDSKTRRPREDANLKRSRSEDPRRDAHLALAEIKAAALDANDVALAKLVHRWEGELFAAHVVASADGAEVIDLAERKRER